MTDRSVPGVSDTPVVIRGGTVVDHRGEARGDVLVAEGRIVAVEPTIEPPAGSIVLDATDCLVMPGLVDLHTHLREPGGERAETVESGSRAAALGGYTAVVAMPNTTPAIDSAAVVRDVLALSSDALCEVAVSGAITVGRAGVQLAPMAEMAALGVRIFTDDGRGVQNGALMRRALEYAFDLGVLLAQHCEDEELAAGGHMHEGAWSSRLGIAGQPSLAEEAMVARDLALVRLVGGPMHFLHLSTTGAIELVRRAKADGLAVTAEATPHHLSLTDAEVASYDPVFKVNPPLRTGPDVDAVRAGLVDGTIDAIATDHAPHPQEAKEEPFDCAPPGMIGLETALSVAYTELVRRRHLTTEGVGTASFSASDLVAVMSTKPAKIAGLDRLAGPLSDRRLAVDMHRGGHGGAIVDGALANLCVFDATANWTVHPGESKSRSHNTPFAGLQLTGRVRHTVFRGEIVVTDGEPQR